MLRAIFRYSLMAPFVILAVLQNYFTAPIVALFANESGYLPAWLTWWQTVDNPLDGDEGWKLKHRCWKDHVDVDHNKYMIYINRILWMWRNPMHGFKYYRTGFYVPSNIKNINFSFKGNNFVSNRPMNKGCVLRTIKPKSRLIFQLYIVYPYSATRCLRINLGWKIWGNPKSGHMYQYVFSVSPFMGWSAD